MHFLIKKKLINKFPKKRLKNVISLESLKKKILCFFLKILKYKFIMFQIF